MRDEIISEMSLRNPMLAIGEGKEEMREVIVRAENPHHGAGNGIVREARALDDFDSPIVETEQIVRLVMPTEECHRIGNVLCEFVMPTRRHRDIGAIADDQDSAPQGGNEGRAKFVRRSIVMLQSGESFKNEILEGMLQDITEQL